MTRRRVRLTCPERGCSWWLESVLSSNACLGARVCLPRCAPMATPALCARAPCCWACCSSGYLGAVRSVGRGTRQPGPAGVHGDLYAAGVAYAHELFLHAGHALFGRHAFCRARRRDSAFVLGLQRHHAGCGHGALRRLFAVLGRHAAAGAAVSVAVQHYDRQLERHELSHGHQGLPRYPVQLLRPPLAWRACSLCPRWRWGCRRSRLVGINRPGLRRHARLGCGAAVPVFSLRATAAPGSFCSGSISLCRWRLRACLPIWGYLHTW